MKYLPWVRNCNKANTAPAVSFQFSSGQYFEALSRAPRNGNGRAEFVMAAVTAPGMQDYAIAGERGRLGRE
jgi:hypothetical protein